MGGADAPDHAQEVFVKLFAAGVVEHIEHPPANEDAPFRPGDVYQETKLEGEHVARKAGIDQGIEVTIVRPTGLFGRVVVRRV